MAKFPTFKGSWPWPWIGTYCIPSCISRRPLLTDQISLKSYKLFVDGLTYVRTDGHLCGRLGGVDLKTCTLNNNNFIKRMLYKNSHWHFHTLSWIMRTCHLFIKRILYCIAITYILMTRIWIGLTAYPLSIILFSH